MRRSEGQTRVIGTLLGVASDNEIEVRNCFQVPHVEDAKVALGKEYNRDMFALHKRVSPDESIVGWFSTTIDGDDLNKNSCMFHDYYGGQCARRPLHLVVDTSLSSNALGIRGYFGTPLMIGDT